MEKKLFQHNDCRWSMLNISLRMYFKKIKEQISFCVFIHLKRYSKLCSKIITIYNDFRRGILI